MNTIGPIPWVGRLVGFFVCKPLPNLIHVGAWLLLLLIWGATSLAAQESPSTNPSPVILATIDNESITSAEVEREVRLAMRDRKLEGVALDSLRNQALQQVIDRHLVLRFLQASKEGASDQDVDFALAKLVRQLQAKETKLPDHLKTLGLSEQELRQELRWKITWSRYVDAHLTDENLRKYYEKHRRDFDGTQLRVAHILLKVEPPSDATASEKVIARAAALREEIVSGKLAFAAAAQANSEAPTADRGGDIGLIRRHEPMPEEFALAAFALEKGAVSPPVVTSFGVHLIQVLDVMPGKKTWQECQEELRPAVTLYLFRWIAQKQRKTVKISYTR